MTKNAARKPTNEQDAVEEALADAGAPGEKVAAYFDALRAFSGKAVGQATVITGETPDLGYPAVVAVMKRTLGFPLHVRFVG